MPFNPFAQDPTPPVRSDGGLVQDQRESQAVDDTPQSGVPDDDWSAVWADNRTEEASAKPTFDPDGGMQGEETPATGDDDFGWSAENPSQPDGTPEDSWDGMWGGGQNEGMPAKPIPDQNAGETPGNGGPIGDGFGWGTENANQPGETPDDDGWDGMWGDSTEPMEPIPDRNADDFDGQSGNAPDRVDGTSNDGGWGDMWNGEEDDEPPSQGDDDFGWSVQMPAESHGSNNERVDDDSSRDEEPSRNPSRPSHDWRDDISTETTAVPAFDWNVDEDTTDWEKDAEIEERKPFPWRIALAAILTLTILCAGGFGAAWLVRHQAAQRAYDASCSALATTGGQWRGLLKEAKALDVDTSKLTSPDLKCAADANGTDEKTAKADGMVKELSASVDAALDGKWEAFKAEAAKHSDLDTSALTATKPKTAADLDLLERRLKDMVDKVAKQKAAEEQKKAAEEQKKAAEEQKKAAEEQKRAAEEQQRATEQSQNATKQTPSYTPPAQTYTPPAQTYTPPAQTYTPPVRPSPPAGNSDADM